MFGSNYHTFCVLTVLLPNSSVIHQTIRKKESCPAPAPAAVYVTLRLPPLDSETGWTGELWSNPVLLILEN